MATAEALIVRPARPEDLPALGRFGAALARVHHAWDPRRFFVVPDMAEGYAWWLGKELKNRKAVVLSAIRRGKVVGYAYGRLEARDWNALRDECGAGIDLYVEPRSRKKGAGGLLAKALLAALEKKGAPRIVISAAAKNRDAQAFFEALGFRATMVEMTLECAPVKRRRAKASKS